MSGKLSASALSSFLESPRKYYWSYVKRIEPIAPSVGQFDDAKICGQLWSEFIDRFYKGRAAEAPNTEKMLADWQEQTAGWVSFTSQNKYIDAMKSWAGEYYQRFSADDGIRNGSEKFVENERFVGYLDGLSHDGKILHEVKSTSRAKSVAEQLWKVQHSVQIQLYSVLTGCEGVLIEFAYKDAPYGIFRAPVMPVTAEQRKGWEQGLNALADRIYSLGDDINNYPCHAGACNIATKNFTRCCEFQALCDMGYTDDTKIAYKQRINKRNLNG